METELFRLHAQIEERHWWFVGRRRIVRSLVERLAPRSGSLVVDVGCGTGANIAALADRYRCVGSDTSAEGIALARQRFPGVAFLRGFAPDALGATAREAEVVLLMDVIEHVADDFQLVSSLLAPMKPGAHLLVTVPAHESLWSQHDVSFGHYRRYDAPRLTAVWDGLAVTARLVSYYNARLYPLVRAVRTVSRLRGHSAGSHGTDFSLPPSPVNRALTELFAGESSRLQRAIDGARTPDGRSLAGYRTGVSLVAVLRREPGEIAPRKREGHVAPDRHTPR